MSEPTPLPSVRIDKWLWAVRLFKTRTFAAQQCSAGKIKRLSKSLKPSTTVKVGDRLLVPSPDGSHKRDIEIAELFDKRVGAPIAQAAYIDHTPAEVLALAIEVAKENRINRQTRKSGDQGRMTKKQRREWRKGLGSNKDTTQQD